MGPGRVGGGAAAGCLAVLLATGCVQDIADAGGAAGDYVDALVAGDTAALAALTCADREPLDLGALGEVADGRLVGTHVSRGTGGTRAEVSAVLERPDGAEDGLLLVLVPEGGGWRVCGAELQQDLLDGPAVTGR